MTEAFKAARAATKEALKAHQAAVARNLNVSSALRRLEEKIALEIDPNFLGSPKHHEVVVEARLRAEEKMGVTYRGLAESERLAWCEVEDFWRALSRERVAATALELDTAREAVERLGVPADVTAASNGYLCITATELTFAQIHDINRALNNPADFRVTGHHQGEALVIYVGGLLPNLEEQ